MKLSVKEFEALVTMGACCKLRRKNCPRRDVARYFTLVANKILEERLPSLQAFTYYRDSKCFLQHVKTGRIVCEVAIDGEGDWEVINPKALLITRKGYVRSTTLDELSLWAESKGKTKYAKGATK